MRITSANLMIAMLMLFLCSCSETYYPESDSEGGWRRNFDPAFITGLGLDPKGVGQFGAYNLRVEGTTSAIVIKDGWVIGEWYAQKGEEDSPVYVASVGKSFALACFGIMVKDGIEGKIPVALDHSSKLYDERWLGVGFPLSDPRKEAITFDQVFRHTAGFGPEGLKDDLGRNLWRDYPAWVVGHDPRWPQTAKLFYPPGHPEKFAESEQWGAHLGAYSSLGFAHIGLVLSTIYAGSASEFLWNRLLQPIGFTGIEFYNPPSPPEIQWFTGGGLKMRPLDLARFAYLLLRRGKWDGTQLLPEEWLDSLVTTPYYQNLRSNVDGYLGERYPQDMYRMFGSGGNFVFIIPSLDMIVVRTGRLHNFFLEKLEHDFLRRAFNMLPAYRTN